MILNDDRLSWGGTNPRQTDFSCAFHLRRRDIMKSLADIFEHTLQDVYYAENAIIKALPKVAKAAKSPALKKAAEDHLAETTGQIKTLEQVFKSIGKKASGEKCDAIEGLIKEADGLMEEAEGTALDAGLLAACQAVEHYEIARYGSLREWAKDLGHDEAHKLLSEILDQEKATNNKLTNLAVTSINKATAKAKAA
jgi:ferritin-like metal-binding protein YciE